MGELSASTITEGYKYLGVTVSVCERDVTPEDILTRGLNQLTAAETVAAALHALHSIVTEITSWVNPASIETTWQTNLQVSKIVDLPATWRYPCWSKGWWNGGQGTQAVHPVYDTGQTELASCCAGPSDCKHGSVLSLLCWGGVMVLSPSC